MYEINIMLLFFAAGVIVWLWIKNKLLRLRQRALQDFALMIQGIFRKDIPSELSNHTQAAGGWGWIIFLRIALYFMIQLLFALNNG